MASESSECSCPGRKDIVSDDDVGKMQMSVNCRDPDDAPRGAILSDLEILREMREGNLIISPFEMSHLGNCSYDVSLGENYYRSDPGMDCVNPWNEYQVRRYWGNPKLAQATGAVYESVNMGVLPGTRFLRIEPGETVLQHTEEYIGGRRNIAAMMKQRQQLGRFAPRKNIFFEPTPPAIRQGVGVCKCAGFGDVGYCQRWTMEITNFNQRAAVVIPVGARVGQIIFFRTGIPSHEYEGKYQEQLGACVDPTDVAKKLQESWNPECMLPKLWLDHR